MKQHLKSQHRQRIESIGWNATITDFHRNGCRFRIRGTEYALIRSGNGFLVRCGAELIWPVATYPDAALAHVWRHSRNQ